MPYTSLNAAVTIVCYVQFQFVVVEHSTIKQLQLYILQISYLWTKDNQDNQHSVYLIYE